MVVAVTDASAASAGIARGDVIVAVDGQTAAERLTMLGRYMAASTSQARQRDATERLLFGLEGSAARVVVSSREGQQREVVLPRRRDFAALSQQPPAGPAFRKLADSVGYMDLRLLQNHEVDAAFRALHDTAVIIFDMRGYPNGTFVSVLGHLTDSTEIEGPRVWVPIAFEPGTRTKHEFRADVSLQPAAVTYSGKTVMLIDERAQSQSEHTALLFRAVHGTVFVGSPTAGANGTGSNFSVPGGLVVGLTGEGVSNADGTQLQRVGLRPDVPAQPTIDGIRAGRDEVLDTALAYVDREHLANKP